jgi:sucrose-6-phosphate hydrolase SacC (GH32 family)
MMELYKLTLLATALAALLAAHPPSTVLAERCVGGPCMPGREHCVGSDPDRPRVLPGFHLMDSSCGMNDPNAQFWDPVHGVLHYFYQKHIAAPPANPDQHGVATWGHFVSRDGVHWAALPVAVWNGLQVLENSTLAPTAYDTQSIYTGSATLVSGLAPDGLSPGVLAIFPGLCRRQDFAVCHHGTLLAAAVPTDYASDPLLTRWSKPAYNPIVMDTPTVPVGRDPSTAWVTDSGEFRFRTFDGVVFSAESAQDVREGRWKRLGLNPTFPVGECPSVYPLPASTPGFEMAYATLQARSALPTHVFKYGVGPGSRSWRNLSRPGDGVMIGSYPIAAAPKNTLVNVSATPGFASLFTRGQMVDSGKFYASKDTLLPPLTPGESPRRVNFGWAQHVGVDGSGPQTLPREVTFNAALGQLQWFPPAEVEQLRSAVLVNRSDVAMRRGQVMDLALPSRSGARSEVLLTFALPPPSVLESSALGGRISLLIMAGDNKGTNATEVYVSFNATSLCAGNRVVVVGVVPAQGRVNTSVVPDTSPIETELRLVAGEDQLEVRVFVDEFIGEAYFQRGREVITFDTPPTTHAGVLLASATDLPDLRVTAWSMSSIWVTPEQVLATPRLQPPTAASHVVLK